MANDDDITTEVANLTKMAKRLGLKGAKAAQYVEDHMTQLGYEAVRSVSYKRKDEGRRTSSGGFGSWFGGATESSDDDD